MSGSVSSSGSNTLNSENWSPILRRRNIGDEADHFSTEEKINEVFQQRKRSRSFGDESDISDNESLGVENRAHKYSRLNQIESDQEERLESTPQPLNLQQREEGNEIDSEIHLLNRQEETKNEWVLNFPDPDDSNAEWLPLNDLLAKKSRETDQQYTFGNLQNGLLQNRSRLLSQYRLTPSGNPFIGGNFPPPPPPPSAGTV